MRRKRKRRKLDASNLATVQRRHCGTAYVSRLVPRVVCGNCRRRCFLVTLHDLNEQETLPSWLAVVLICALGAFGMGCAGRARVSSNGGRIFLLSARQWTEPLMASWVAFRLHAVRAFVPLPTAVAKGTGRVTDSVGGSWFNRELNVFLAIMRRETRNEEMDLARRRV